MGRIAPDEMRRFCTRVREDIVEMIHEAGSGHPGGALSIVELLAVLYLEKMRHDPANPQWPARDRFILSKGHACTALYSVMKHCGYFEGYDLKTFRKLGSPFQGHPCRLKAPGIEVPTGSLGQGLSVGNGMAMAARLDRLDYKVYVLCGDGELQEGQIWEAAMSAVQHRLDNVRLIVDYNNLQIDGTVSEVKEIKPLEEKFESFGWHTVIIDGHDVSMIRGALDEADRIEGRPTAVIAKTIKGKGVSFMENAVEFHGKAPDDEQFEQAMRELEKE